MEFLSNYSDSDSGGESDGKSAEPLPATKSSADQVSTPGESVNKHCGGSKKGICFLREEPVNTADCHDTVKNNSDLRYQLNEHLNSESSSDNEKSDFFGLDFDSEQEDESKEETFMRGDHVWSKPISNLKQQKYDRDRCKSQQGTSLVNEPPSPTEQTDCSLLISHTKSDEKQLDHKQAKANRPVSTFWQGSKPAEDWNDPDKLWKSHEPSNSLDNQRDESFSAFEPRTKKKCSDDFPQRPGKIEQSASNEITTPYKNCFFVHHKISPHLHQTTTCQPPKKVLIQLDGHAGAVNRIKWCSKSEYSHLLASVSMDTSVKIWNVFSHVNNCVQTLSSHSKAVRDLSWSPSGFEVLSCGFDKTARLHDVLKGSEIRRFEHHDFLTCIKYHPVDPNYFLAGSRDQVICWDVRTNERPIKVFKFRNNYGLVQDVIFLRNGTEFAISTDLVCREAADRSIIVYDFSSGVPLSNQVYQERYTCPRLCLHPHVSEMMAQSNGDYIALFSTIRPYKMNKCKRFDKHKVLGYSVGCGYSSDGRYVVSGGSDSSVTIYDYQRALVLQKLGEQGEIYLDVAWHPVLKSTLASCNWSGKITIWQ